MSNEECEDAKDIRKEAKRRRKLYKDDDSFKGSYGNYLRIIGYDKDKEFDKRYSYIPGTTVSTANGSSLKWLDMFIHAPFKEDIEGSKATKNKNDASIVIQYAFKIEGEDKPKCKLLIGGDAEHDIWQHILGNNQDDSNLQWNIFLAPNLQIRYLQDKLETGHSLYHHQKKSKKKIKILHAIRQRRNIRNVLKQKIISVTPLLTTR